MLHSAIFLAVGLALIITGGDWFVGAAVRLAEYLRMPHVVIGSTLVSLATTSPELVVSLMAGTRGESGLAVGNAVGSCVCNIGLILGLTAAIKQIDVHPAALRVPLVALVLFGLLLSAMTTDLVLLLYVVLTENRVTRRQGVLLLVSYAVYLAVVVGMTVFRRG